MGATLGTYFVTLVLIDGALLIWMPRLSRRELFFAVTVRADFARTEQGRATLRRYDLRVALVSVGCAVLAAVAGWEGKPVWAPAVLLIQFAAIFWVYLDARRSVLPHAVKPAGIREAQLALRVIPMPGGWPAHLGPFAILAGAAYYLHSAWARIPERFPVHWGLNGQANGWSTRTAAGVYGPLAEGAVVVGLLVLLCWGIVRWTRRVHASGTAAEAEVARERRALMLVLFIEYLLAGMMAWAALLPLRPEPEKSPSAGFPIGMLVVLVAAVVVMFLMHRPPEPVAAEGAPPIGDRTEDRYWKAGIFYVNRSDPALFVEKRFGIGYTFNFGHRMAWVLLAGLVMIPILAALAARK